MLSADADEDTRHGERQQTSALEKIYQVEQLKLTANDTSTTVTVHASSTIMQGQSVEELESWCKAFNLWIVFFGSLFI